MFPIVLAKDLDKEYYKQKWQRQFVDPGRQRAEGIWRRTQEEATKEKSGWTNSRDARRRIIHFLDEYDMIINDSDNVDFCIREAYLWMSITLPSGESKDYERRVREALPNFNWMQITEDNFQRNDLTFWIKRFEQHPEDIRADRYIPSNYCTLEFCLKTNGMDIAERVIDSPWNILNSGIRERGSRTENPQVMNDFKEIEDYLPAQVELAGGASIDLGIPPLNHLHTTYNVTRSHDGSFVFGDDNFLVDLISNPIEFYKKAGMAYRTCILAEPNEFYKVLKDMYDNRLAVGDVITNNFDGLTSLVGLKEKYVRRYDEPKHYPEIEFDKEAKSLLVIGNHADRRKVQHQAREKGLKVIYVDPEMYVNYFGDPVEYPLESIKEEDLLINKTAVDFALEMEKIINS